MKKHKITWIDGLVLLVLVLLAVGTFVKFSVNGDARGEQETVNFSYQLKIEGIRQCTVDSLQVGDTVYDNEGKGAVGTISAIAVTPATSLYYAPDGTVEEVEYEDHYNVTLTLSAEGTPAEGTYKVGTYTLKVNQYSLYFTKYSIWSATIVSMD